MNRVRLRADRCSLKVGIGSTDAELVNRQLTRPDEAFPVNHEKPMLLSMANAGELALVSTCLPELMGLGPNTNGSQFFITTCVISSWTLLHPPLHPASSCSELLRALQSSASADDDAVSPLPTWMANTSSSAASAPTVVWSAASRTSRPRVTSRTSRS